MLNITVRNKKFNCDICLEHKVSIFTGNSGVGKTCFVEALLDESGAYKVEYSTPIHVELLSERNWEILLNSSYNCIPLFIVDDRDFVFTKEFGEQFNKLGSCYLIIVARTDYREKKLNKMNTLSVDGDSVYEFVADGIEHKIIPKINFVETPISSGVTFDKLLCEDEGSGYTFFRNLFNQSPNVESSHGKDSLVTYLLEHSNEYKDINSLFLVVDYSAIGLRLNDIMLTANMLNINVFLAKRYKSFEYMLLRSNMFNIPIDDIIKDELEYVSLEAKCEYLLNSITNNKIYSYTKKSELKSCYYKDCCSMDRSKLSCDRGLSGNKFKALLSGTEFEYLLMFKVV